jgi:hypothetical protein
MRDARFIEVAMRCWNEGDRGLADIAHFALKDRLKRVGKNTVYFFDEAQCRWMKGIARSVRSIVGAVVEASLRDVETCFAAQSLAEPNEAARALIDAKRAAVAKRIVRVQQHVGMAGVTSLTTFMCTDNDDFERHLDRHPHLLGVKNGVVDLRTGELRDRRPEDMIFTVVDVVYDPEGSPAVMAGGVLASMYDRRMAAFVRKLMGCGVTGEVCRNICAVYTARGRKGFVKS